MKKFKAVKGEQTLWDIEAAEMKIEGGAAVFYRAQSEGVKWSVLVIPLHSFDYVAQESPED